MRAVPDVNNGEWPSSRTVPDPTSGHLCWCPATATVMVCDLQDRVATLVPRVCIFYQLIFRASQKVKCTASEVHQLKQLTDGLVSSRLMRFNLVLRSLPVQTQTVNVQRVPLVPEPDLTVA